MTDAVMLGFTAGANPTRLSRLLLIAAFLLLACAVSSAEAAGLAVDQLVTASQGTAATSIASPTFSTTNSNELLLAFVTSDGPAASGAQTFATVTGGGVTWQLRRRANAQYGTAEIWQAVAPAPLTNARVTATRLTGSYQGSITVATFTGADATATGATGGASAATGAPSVALTTTRPGSWVWGAGSDWTRAVARTVGSGQAKVSEYLASSGDTFWVQRQNATTAAAGTSVTVNDTAPTNDRWNLASIEVVAAGNDTQAPSAPTGLKAGSVAANRVTLNWTSSNDDFGVAGYRIFRDGTQVGDVTGTTFSDTGVTAGNTYAYAVKAYDGAGNVSPASDPLSITTPAPDTTAPSVSVSAPAAGATVSGTVSVQADATDDVGVTSVQLLLDGSPLGSPDTTSPFSASWDTTGAANGPHTLSARAQDAAGNTGTATNVGVAVNNGGTDPQTIGQWGAVIPLPAVAVHSALTPQGKVLIFQGTFSQGGMQYLFDPSTGNTSQLVDASPNLFCAAQAVLADGRVDVAGGTSLSGGLGIRDSTAFNWKTNSWSNLAPMKYPRWYATATTLNDGKVLVTSGSDQSLGDLVPIPELYSPSSDSWKELTAASRRIPFYSFVYQLPNGKVIRVGASEEATPTETLDLNTNQWDTVDSRAIDGGSVANYAPGKFLKAGSASDSGFSGASASTAYTLDMNQSSPAWQPTSSMSFPRSFLNLTNLPDGTVLATGGGTDKSSYVDANGVLTPELWDPSTGKWSKLAPMAESRLYHSGALLLPDGRVFIDGGGNDARVTDHKTGQIYSPPYLFKGARPTISSAPATVDYGKNTFVGTPDASSIRRVTLIRTSSVTHAFDQNARSMPLQFTQSVGGLDVKMPDDGNVAPPGYYMLFLVNDQGVPSVASFVRFPAPYEDSQAPDAPTNLAATGRIGAASLSWTAASDNLGVTKYNVHRSTTPGFTPSAANKIGQSSNTTYDDSGIAPGDYYYRVTAQDAAGNVGPPSDEATTTVVADTAPPSRPTGLTATASGRTAALTWTGSSDNVGVSGYRVFRDGAQVGTTETPSYSDGNLAAATTYRYTVEAYDAADNRSAASDPAVVTTGTSSVVALDQVVTTHQSANGTSISSPAISTTQAGELLVAFIASDGPSGAGTQSFTTVAGGGLTWRLRQRANTQAGTAEIWQAAAPNPLTNVVVTATRGGRSSQGAMTLAAFTGAELSTLGAVGTGAAASGAPTASLTTTRAGSWVWGVGVDWDNDIARTPGTGQSLVDQYFSPSGDTYWTQRRDATTPGAGTSVMINDTAPTGDRWNLSLVEIPRAGP
jgi:chitodextrinase